MSAASGFGRVRFTAVGSGGWPWGGRRCRAPLALWRVAIALPAAACNYAPTMDLFGSYFPAWMLCMIVGVGLSAAMRSLFVLLRLEPDLGPPVLIYPSLALLLTVFLKETGPAALVSVFCRAALRPSWLAF